MHVLQAGSMKVLEFTGESGPVEVIRILGEIDVYNSYEVKGAVEDLLALGKSRIAIDLSQVPYIDSSGLGALITAQSRVDKAGGALFLIKPSEQIRNVFELTKMGAFFRTVGSAAEAV